MNKLFIGAVLYLILMVCLGCAGTGATLVDDPCPPGHHWHPEVKECFQID